MRRPDITLAKKIIHWEPKVALDAGLQKTIAYFKDVDMRNFRKPTGHDAHQNSQVDQTNPRKKIKT